MCFIYQSCFTIRCKCAYRLPIQVNSTFSYCTVAMEHHTLMHIFRRKHIQKYLYSMSVQLAFLPSRIQRKWHRFGVSRLKCMSGFPCFMNRSYGTATMTTVINNIYIQGGQMKEDFLQGNFTIGALVCKFNRNKKWKGLISFAWIDFLLFFIEAEMPISSGAEGHIGFGVDTSIRWFPKGGKKFYMPFKVNSYLQR